MFKQSGDTLNFCQKNSNRPIDWCRIFKQFAGIIIVLWYENDLLKEAAIDKPAIWCSMLFQSNNFLRGQNANGGTCRRIFIFFKKNEKDFARQHLRGSEDFLKIPEIVFIALASVFRRCWKSLALLKDETSLLWLELKLEMSISRHPNKLCNSSFAHRRIRRGRIYRKHSSRNMNVNVSISFRTLRFIFKDLFQSKKATLAKRVSLKTPKNEEINC